MKPMTRRENFLAKIAGDQYDEAIVPATREEHFLNAIATGCGGGGLFPVIVTMSGGVNEGKTETDMPGESVTPIEESIAELNLSGYSADKTNAEIYAAANAGLIPMLVFVHEEPGVPPEEAIVPDGGESLVVPTMGKIFSYALPSYVEQNYAQFEAIPRHMIDRIGFYRISIDNDKVDIFQDEYPATE